MHRLRDIVLLAALIAISTAPRLVGLGRFTSVDEPFWLRQGANFYYALGQREFQNTLYEYHPAVTTMWIVAAGMLAYFPQYRALGEGYLKPGKFDLFLPAHGKDPLALLIASRTIQVVIVVVLLLVLYFLLRRLFEEPSAFVATALISVSPFFLGHSRLLNHEAMLALFLVISFISLLVYLVRGHHFVLLLISAASAALAQLTKSSGMPLFPLVVLMLAVDAFINRDVALSRRIVRGVRLFGLWFVLTAAFYVIFWPGMWVAPGTMLSEVYGNALSYAFQGARLSVLPGLDASHFGVGTLWAGLQIYLSDLIWRTTPITWLGVLMGIVFAIAYQRQRERLDFRLTILYALLLAAAFVLMFGVQRGPKPPHYTVTSYVCLDLVAGLGFSAAWTWVTGRLPAAARDLWTWAIFSIIIGLQLISSLFFYPYYITYYNPIVEALRPGIQNPTLNGTGYGAGLDQAAAYLSQKPDARNLVVMSANGYGCFSYYFPGRTVPMNNLILSDPELVQILQGSDYAVVDYYNQTRSYLAGTLTGVEPEKVIWVNGIDYLHIYRAADLLAHVDQASP